MVLIETKLSESMFLFKKTSWNDHEHYQCKTNSRQILWAEIVRKLRLKLSLQVFRVDHRSLVLKNCGIRIEVE